MTFSLSDEARKYNFMPNYNVLLDMTSFIVAKPVIVWLLFN